MPMVERDGKKYIVPAEKFGERGNCESPELYPVYPFRLYGVGKKDVELTLHPLLPCFSLDIAAPDWVRHVFGPCGSMPTGGDEKRFLINSWSKEGDKRL